VQVTTLRITVGNGRYYGGGNAVEKAAEISITGASISTAWGSPILGNWPHGVLFPPVNTAPGEK
jgi:hypothetical protein